MKYDNKLPYLCLYPKPILEADEILGKWCVSPARECFICGDLTHWLDISAEGYICSEECEAALYIYFDN